MPEDKLKFLGDRIRSARKDCGLTQQALADQADLAVKTIQDVERGRKYPTYETLCQLIERLGISPIHCSHRRCPRKMKQSNAL